MSITVIGQAEAWESVSRFVIRKSSSATAVWDNVAVAKKLNVKPSRCLSTKIVLVSAQDNDNPIALIERHGRQPDHGSRLPALNGAHNKTPERPPHRTP
jgi:hypothetical protein